MKKKKTHKQITYIMIWVVLLLVLVAAFQVVSNLIWSASAEEEASTYDAHFVLITDDEDETFWDSVYASALKEGKKQGVYVERFGENLAVSYSKDQLLSMAIEAGVDGIILEADETEETQNLINRAGEAGIPVITILQDASASSRIAFVGVNSYSVGQEYGKQLVSLEAKKIPAEEGREVLVLSNTASEQSGQAQILMGIRETLSASFPDRQIKVENDVAGSDDNFAMEEYLRDLFLSEDLPDYLVCLDSRTTSLAYQAAVDYNRVSDIDILGYYDSDSILTAVKDGTLNSTLSINTEEMGSLSVEALADYVDSGYINNYMVVDFEMLDADSAAERLAEGGED